MAAVELVEVSRADGLLELGGDAAFDRVRQRVDVRDPYESVVSGPPTNAPDSPALCRLVELSLVTPIDTEPPKYVVLPPDTALDVLARRRERELAGARRKMVELTCGSTAVRRAARRCPDGGAARRAGDRPGHDQLVAQRP
ncbi:hypothetical protein AB0H36_16955 [Kribbella sp. NPDC050820]|uniref:hypothetical protein n=1 Tax=Kribbella sp. NPDC050820 TaxID=3155408 RepID=UPI0034087492